MSFPTMENETKAHVVDNTATISPANTGTSAPNTVLEQIVGLGEKTKETTTEKMKRNHEDDEAESQHSTSNEGTMESNLAGKNIETQNFNSQDTNDPPKVVIDPTVHGIERKMSFNESNPFKLPVTEGRQLNIAQNYSAEEIFDMYNTRLNINASNATNKTGTLSHLIYGITDHLREIDNRIKHLEAGQRVDTGVDDPNERPSSMQETTGASKETLGLVDTRVIFCSSDEDLAADFKDVTNDMRWDKVGPSSAKPKSNPFLTILYEAPRGKDPDLPSTASDTDILAIRMISKPIALFFERLAGYTVHTDHLVRMTKPFPFLIRNMTAIKSQLTKLLDFYA